MRPVVHVMMMTAAALAITLVACTSRHPETTSHAIATSRPASHAGPVAAGMSATLPDHLTVTIASLTAGGDDLGAWLTTDISITNQSPHSQPLPTLGIRCAGRSAVGGHRTVPSPLSLIGSVPARSTRDGTLFLVLPGDRRLGRGVPAWRAPAAIQVSELPPAGDGSYVARIAIPVQALAELNASRNK
jgi:hypothetical protein